MYSSGKIFARLELKQNWAFFKGLRMQRIPLSWGNPVLFLVASGLTRRVGIHHFPQAGY
jgi:hypothetical protein